MNGNNLQTVMNYKSPLEKYKKNCAHTIWVSQVSEFWNYEHVLGNLGDVSFGMLKLGGLGEVSFEMLKLSEVGK